MTQTMPYRSTPAVDFYVSEEKRFETWYKTLNEDEKGVAAYYWEQEGAALDECRDRVAAFNKTLTLISEPEYYAF